MGKVSLNGEFHWIGSLNSLLRSLLTVVSMMRVAELTNNPFYLKYLFGVIRKTVRTQKNFSQPGQQ